MDSALAMWAAVATHRVTGEPSWLLILSGPGNTKTETIYTLKDVDGVVWASAIQGRSTLLSGTARKDMEDGATGGLLRQIGDDGVLVIKDFTSIISTDKTSREQVMAALRETYDGRWDRPLGVDGGKGAKGELTWEGNLSIISAVTSVWDAKQAAVAEMGDRFLIIRTDSSDPASREAATRHAVQITGKNRRREMKQALNGATHHVLNSMTDPDTDLTDAELDQVSNAANVVAAARSTVERENGTPVWPHAMESGARLANQLGRFFVGALSIGCSRGEALRLTLRVAGDTIPPLRMKVLADVLDYPDSDKSEVAARLGGHSESGTWRVLSELTMLGLLDKATAPAPAGRRQERDVFRVDPEYVDKINKLVAAGRGLQVSTDSEPVGSVESVNSDGESVPLLKSNDSQGPPHVIGGQDHDSPTTNVGGECVEPHAQSGDPNNGYSMSPWPGDYASSNTPSPDSDGYEYKYLPDSVMNAVNGDSFANAQSVNLETHASVSRIPHPTEEEGNIYRGYVTDPAEGSGNLEALANQDNQPSSETEKSGSIPGWNPKKDHQGDKGNGGWG